MTVEQAMTKQVWCCGANDRLNRAAQLMWDHDCGCVPVVDENNLAIGMITDRDVCMAAYTTNLPLSSLRVGDIMARPAIGCGPFDTVDHAGEPQRPVLRR